MIRGGRSIRDALAALAALALVAGTPAAPRARAAFLPPDGSRSAAVHRIPLYDEDNAEIDPTVKSGAQPFSERRTCNKCHEYAKIAKGRHFNAMDPDVPPGRPGEPWILADPQTGTQLPLSYRAWPGTWRPEAVGLTPWRFLQQFGRQLPGGGVGELPLDEATDPNARWIISGQLEINCLGCHSVDRSYDATAWGGNCEKQNFKYAATAASGLAVVTGSVKSLPDSYDPLNPDALLDTPTAVVPAVQYDLAKFDPAKKAFFDLLNNVSPNRCYFCHTARRVGQGAPEAWRVDGDVHLAAGLSCADCHRHGLDHAMTRNYDGEPQAAKDVSVTSLSCRGCHLGAESAAAGPETLGGRLGAPVPRHPGIPTVHFDKLACTACHSGPMPAARALRAQTSMAHGLGVHGKERGPDTLPLLAEPVFMRGSDGRIAPHRMLWPAFWGRLKDGQVTPLAPDVVAGKAGALLEPDKSDKTKPPVMQPLTPDRAASVLEKLADADAGEAIYVAGGKLYRRAADGTLAASDHAAAAPYAWPVGHDVRPAARSLGAGARCTDCHSADAPFFFGQVLAESPAQVAEPTAVAMYTLQGKDPTYLTAWALSFQGRPYFKILGFATAGIIAAVLALYGFLGLAALLKWANGKTA